LIINIKCPQSENQKAVPDQKKIITFCNFWCMYVVDTGIKREIWEEEEEEFAATKE
jgi:uncharacterized protein YutD